ncbi:MAG: hypothetical protein KGJ66_04245 [Alphaproteobacteria bacterium]|nr:hypothetical protein [Alphaproteobacteria bacterium]
MGAADAVAIVEINGGVGQIPSSDAARARVIAFHHHVSDWQPGVGFDEAYAGAAPFRTARV